MRALVQRVSSANVVVEGEVLGEIGTGFLVLLGCGRDDGPDDLEWIVRKISQLRVFADDSGKMNWSLLDAGASALVVSQFTLYGDCRKGNRPSFSRAMAPEQAESMVEQVVVALRQRGIHTETGRFGADMRVSLVNEGPVTLMLDSENRKRDSLKT